MSKHTDSHSADSTSRGAERTPETLQLITVPIPSDARREAEAAMRRDTTLRRRTFHSQIAFAMSQRPRRE